VLRQYEALFNLENIELLIEPHALDFIAQKALEYKLGARGLRSLCEAILTDAMFEMPTAEVQENKRQLIISKAYAEEKIDRSNLSRLHAA
jgi:ATP-dependent Clp protease ATP-binding subunit ClpX